MKISAFRTLAILCLLLALSTNALAQEATSGWKIQLENAKAFIENQGQFNHPNVEGSILYAYDDAQTKIYFTEKGTAYSFVDMERREKEKRLDFTSFEDWFEYDKKEGRYDVTLDFAAFKWENANLGVDIIPSEQRQDYFSYSYKDNRGEVVNQNFLRGYKTLTYRNIYPGIDVVYTFHPVNGLKYTIVVHPGADPSKIKMNYTETPWLDAIGNLHVETVFGDILDHAPVTYYQDDPDQSVPTSFAVDQNIVTFHVEPYDPTRTLIIDPWVQTPTLNISNGVWECERDGAGNVYIIGGDMPMRLLKYNSTGTIQWTYTTPWDTTNSWLGTFATDLAGNSYVTSGSIAELQKILPNGTMDYYNNAPLLSGDEYWNISFNCDQTKLIIGGTSGVAFPVVNLWGAIFDINTSNGSINSVAHVGSMPSLMDLQEVRSLTSCKNARYYYLMHDTIGCIDENFGACPSSGPSLFEINSTYYLAYKSETYRPNNGNAGIMCIRANPAWLYSANGTNVHKRMLSDGTIVGAASIPGGSSVTVLGDHQIENSGLEIDSCGYVYAGSTNCVAKYDDNLNLITTYATSYRVSDLTVTNSGNLIIAGTTGDNSWTVPRTGYVEYINMSTCNPQALICCDANICPVSPVCSVDPAFNLNASSPGGTWSGPGITDPVNGTFNPAIAGQGMHWVYYTQPCGTDSILVVVNLCAQVDICQELNGDLSVTGGTGPYNWYVGSLGSDCSQCLFAPLCFPAAANCPIYFINWTLIGSGTSITPTGDTICVVDTYSNSDTTFFYGALPQCGICPDLSAATSSLVNATCNGSTDGSFFVQVPAGTAPFDYYLELGGSPVAQFLNTGSTQTFTGLGAGTYTLYIEDDNNCGDTITVTITEPAPVTVSISGSISFCTGSNTVLTATGGFASYSWSSGEFTQSIVVTTGGTYTVTVTNGSGCPGTDEVNVTEMTAADATITSAGPFCFLDGPSNMTAVDPGGTWSGTGITDPNTGTFDPSIAGIGTVQIIYTISGSCGDADTIMVDIVSLFDATITPAGPFCTNDDTVHLLSADPGGSWTFNGTASPNVFDPAGMGAGTHEIIYTIPGNCGNADTISILVNQAPTLGGGSTNETCEDANDGTIILLINSGTPPFDASWSNGDTGTELDSLMPGYYNVTVTDSNGCHAATMFTVIQSDISCYDPIVYVPNIFTPNGDGTNDILYVRGRGIETLQFIVYDRWGERVFKTEDPNQGWDGTFRGKPVESAVFVWYLKATLSNDETIKRKGNVTIIR